MIVVEEAVVVFRGIFLKRRNRGSVNEENVEVSIVVVVESMQRRKSWFLAGFCLESDCCSL